MRAVGFVREHVCTFSHLALVSCSYCAYILRQHFRLCVLCCVYPFGQIDNHHIYGLNFVLLLLVDLINNAVAWKVLLFVMSHCVKV